VHDCCAVPIEESQDADTAAKADAFAYPRRVLITAFQLLVQVVCLPPYWVEAYGRPILSVA